MSKEDLVKPMDVFNFNYQQNLPYFIENFSKLGKPPINFKFPESVIVDVDPYDVFLSFYKAYEALTKMHKLPKIKKIMKSELAPGDVFSFSITMNKNLREKLDVLALSPIYLQEYAHWFIQTKNHGQDIRPFDVYTLARYFCNLVDLN